MPLDDNDKKWLNGLGVSIINQIISPVRGDLNTVHTAVIGSRDGVADVAAAVAALRADVNFIHTLSPFSLKAIREAVSDGRVSLTDEQAKAIAGQLSSVAVESLEAALADDFEGVKARIAALPGETIAALKAAL